MRKDSDAFGPLPEKPAALFDHPQLGEMYDFLAMDLHAMKYAEQCVKEERAACAALCTEIVKKQTTREAKLAGLDCWRLIRARGDRRSDK